MNHKMNHIVNCRNADNSYGSIGVRLAFYVFLLSDRLQKDVGIEVGRNRGRSFKQKGG